MVFWVTKPEDGGSNALQNLVATLRTTRYFTIRMFNDRQYKCVTLQVCIYNMAHKRSN